MSDKKNIQNVHNLNVQKVVQECHLVADTAKDGCPAATYEKMASLLEDVISLSPLMNSDYPVVINSIVKELLNSQQLDDLIKISDYVEFELIYILNHYQTQNSKSRSSLEIYIKRINLNLDKTLLISSIDNLTV